MLDDPLSAVDAATEAEILAALDRAKADRTFVLITNRVAAAARTERIVVLDDGAGFSPADLELDFVSHATSKLGELADLLYAQFHTN